MSALDNEFEKISLVMQSFSLIDMSELTVEEHLTFIAACLRFSRQLEPIVKNHIGSYEDFQRMKEEKDKANAAKFVEFLMAVKKE